MSSRALVIGGTGPTGPFIVNGLRARGFAVAMLHSGRHERDEIPGDVEHLHTDPFDEAKLAAALDGRSFDVCVATYGRLRATCWMCWLSSAFSSRSAVFHDSPAIASSPFHLPWPQTGCW